MLGRAGRAGSSSVSRLFPLLWWAPGGGGGRTGGRLRGGCGRGRPRGCRSWVGGCWWGRTPDAAVAGGPPVVLVAGRLGLPPWGLFAGAPSGANGSWPERVRGPGEGAISQKPGVGMKLGHHGGTPLGHAGVTLASRKIEMTHQTAPRSVTARKRARSGGGFSSHCRPETPMQLSTPHRLPVRRPLRNRKRWREVLAGRDPYPGGPVASLLADP